MPETITSRDAARFPIVASCTLLGLYLFFKVSERCWRALKKVPAILPTWSGTGLTGFLSYPSWGPSVLGQKVCKAAWLELFGVTTWEDISSCLNCDSLG